MPQGPGIGDFDSLYESVRDKVKVENVQIGIYNSTQYSLAGDVVPYALGDEENVAVNSAVQWVADKQAKELSELTHEYSWSWQEGENGSLIDAHLDAVHEGDYDAMKRESAELQAAIKAALS
jgi:hypothetical protein